MVSKTDAFRSAKLKLQAKPVSQGDGTPSLSLQFYGPNVGFAVYTASERDTDQKKWINASMDYFTLGQIFELLRGYAGYGHLAGQLPKSITVENYNTVKNDDGSKNRTLVSFTEFGIDDNDMIYLKVISADQSRPMINFPFHNDYWHVFKDTSTGQPLTPQRMSRLATLSTINVWSDMIPDAVFEEFCNGKAAGAGVSDGDGQQGGGGGGGWKQNNGGGGWNGGQKKQWNGGGNNNGGGWKKQYNNNGGGGGGWKQNGGGGGWKQNNGGGYNNNGGGNNQGGYQQNGGGNGQGNNQGQQGGGSPSLDDNVPF